MGTFWYFWWGAGFWVDILHKEVTQENFTLVFSEEPDDNMESATSEEVPLRNQAKTYFKSLLDRDVSTLSAETLITTTLDPDRKGITPNIFSITWLVLHYNNGFQDTSAYISKNVVNG